MAINKSKKQIDLSIIIINFGNSKKYTLDCLNSIGLPNNSEIILVDNISKDGLQEEILKNYKYVKYLRRNKAYSFVENNNYGYSHSSGKYVLFLNNDTRILAKNTFEQIIRWMDKNKDVGIVSGKLLNSDGKTIQPTGGYFPKLLNVFNWMLFIDDIPLINRITKSYHPQINHFSAGIVEQDWVTGAFYFTRKEILEKVGVFDMDYDAYVEEVDLAYRIKKIGMKVVYNPNWGIIHYGGVSYGNERSLLNELKNLKVFYKKHYPKWQLPILKAIIKLGCLLRIIVFGLLRPDLSKIYAKAIRQI